MLTGTNFGFSCIDARRRRRPPPLPLAEMAASAPLHTTISPRQFGENVNESEFHHIATTTAIP